MSDNNTLEEIKNRLNIVDYIGQYVNLKQNGSNFMGLCPFHNEKTPSFCVSDTKRMFTCFGCKESGDIITFDMKYFKTTFKESLEKLAKLAGVEITNYHKNDLIENEKEQLYEIYRTAANNFYKNLFNKNNKHALNYLNQRKITLETIKKFGIGYADNGFNSLYTLLKNKGYNDNILLKSKLFNKKNDKIYDFFFNRVMFPILDINGKVVAFSGRDISNNKEIKSKYLNSTDIILTNGYKFYKKSEHIFCLNIAKYTKKDYLIICEGNLDAIMMHQHGFDNTIACLGGAFNEIHVNILKRYTKNIILSFDNDSSGVGFTLKAIDLLNKFNFNIKVLDLNPYKDPDEFLKNMSDAEMNIRINNSIDCIIYKINYIKSKYDTKDIQQYNQYLIEIAHMLEQLNNNIIIDKYIQYIAKNEKLNFNDLKNTIYNNFTNQTNNNKLTFQEREKIEETKTIIKDINNNYNELLLINYIIENNKLINSLKPILYYDDFINEYIGQIYNDFINGIEYNDIIKKYEELNINDEYSEILKILKIELFSNKISKTLNINDDNYVKAVNEVMINIKENSLKNKINKLDNSLENINILSNLNKQLKDIKKIEINYV